MRTIHVPIVLCIVAGISAVAGAHVGPTFYAQQVDPTTITIDGLGNDPGWNPPLWDSANTITADMLGGNTTGGDMQPLDDWDVVMKVGWSAPPDNRLYLYAEVKDDLLNDESQRSGDAWRDDSMDIVLDADHGGGDFGEFVQDSDHSGGDVWTVRPDGSICQLYRLRAGEADFPPGPGNDESNTLAAHCIADPTRIWDSGAPYMEVAVQKPVGRTSVTYAWEIKMMTSDWLGESAATTQWHVNVAGQTIGLSVKWNDADAMLDTRDAAPGTQGPEMSSRGFSADEISDFIFIEGPTAVEAVSWGAIKASFQR